MWRFKILIFFERLLPERCFCLKAFVPVLKVITRVNETKARRFVLWCGQRLSVLRCAVCVVCCVTGAVYVSVLLGWCMWFGSGLSVVLSSRPLNWLSCWRLHSLICYYFINGVGWCNFKMLHGEVMQFPQFNGLIFLNISLSLPKLCFFARSAAQAKTAVRLGCVFFAGLISCCSSAVFWRSCKLLPMPKVGFRQSPR